MLGIKTLKEKKRQKKELEAQQALEAQRAKEMQARITVKRTLASMKKQSEKLDSYKKDYIQKAREASMVGNQQTFQLSKAGLKLCLTKQKFLDSMIANFELSVQVGDMNKVIGEFVDGMSIISDQMKSVTSTFDMTKAQMAYEKALTNNASQYEALNAFLDTAAESVDTIDVIDDGISDDEIDALITNQVLDTECDIDKEIEAKIKDVREKLNA